MNTLLLDRLDLDNAVIVVQIIEATRVYKGYIENRSLFLHIDGDYRIKAPLKDAYDKSWFISRFILLGQTHMVCPEEVSFESIIDALKKVGWNG